MRVRLAILFCTLGVAFASGLWVDARGDSLRTPIPTPFPRADDVSLEPPPLRARIDGGRSIDIGTGTNSWRVRMASSVGDAFAIATNPRAEPVRRGAVIEVFGVLPWHRLSHAVVDVHPPVQSTFGSLPAHWNYGAAPRELPHRTSRKHLSFVVDLPPGVHVIRLAIAVDESVRPSSWGEAEYGLLIEVMP